ncbi:hypothetical protein RFI_21910 [Reticulomyxa filosa]|uniref:Uncharacterized protein n=1 Tax=Reticulomyxa filosa TaxID=46433 RepID=X6MNP2_RETFI|nr:hypothetical protein RFI_21910 [Reticulomyxa filosa]|eukprot:ETO15454.1 hypothetical protein RFI_21910 [Reticulomyxa filosa]
MSGMFADDVALWTSIYTSDEKGTAIDANNLIVDQQMTFQQHINYVYGKASKKLGYLTFLCSYKFIVHDNNQTILEYACALWNGQAFLVLQIHDTVNVIYHLNLKAAGGSKLYHKCIRWSMDHNLAMAYQLWRNNHDIEIDVKIIWRVKLSTLYIAYASEVGIE